MWIRWDGKNSDPGSENRGGIEEIRSGINIPDPQHRYLGCGMRIRIGFAITQKIYSYIFFLLNFFIFLYPEK